MIPLFFFSTITPSIHQLFRLIDAWSMACVVWQWIEYYYLFFQEYNICFTTIDHSHFTAEDDDYRYVM